MTSKLIFLVEYTELIKFKLAFDTKNNTSTFDDLKTEVIKRLQLFA